MNDLLAWLKATDDHPLIAACIFHYEFEFIHPFVDGNGRMGRLWQTLIPSRWEPLFALVPLESLIHDQQAGYYAALNAANGAGASTPSSPSCARSSLAPWPGWTAPPSRAAAGGPHRAREYLGGVPIAGLAAEVASDGTITLRPRIEVDAKTAQVLPVSQRDAEAFVEALLHPTKPNAAMRAAAKRWSKTVEGR